MPFFFLIIGALVLITAIMDTHVEVGKMLFNDFSGEDSFAWWLIALSVLGSIGFVNDDDLKGVAKYLLFLILLAILLKGYRNDKNFFSMFYEQINEGLTK